MTKSLQNGAAASRHLRGSFVGAIRASERSGFLSKCVALRRKLRRAVFGVGFLLALAVIVWLLRAPLLTGWARMWVVDQPLRKSDAIVVLGGRPDLRGPEAARLYHLGLAPKVLYMDVRLGPSAEMGIVPSEREQTRRLLLSNNVPETAMVAIGHAVGSTFDESCAVREWITRTGAHDIIIATDLAHTRRVRWIFGKELQGLTAGIHIKAIEPEAYGTTNWWQHEEGLEAFQSEFIKLIYYHVKY
jgi:uncharacterized SAM-binding protein YcdF (DUF218 family)